MTSRLNLANELFPAYARLVYSLEMSLESVGSSLFQNDEQVELQKMRSHLTATQNDELDGHIRTLRDVLNDFIGRGQEKRVTYPVIIKPEDADVGALFTHFTLSAYMSLHRNRRDFACAAAIVSIDSAFEIYCGELYRHFYSTRPAAIPGQPSVGLDRILSANDKDEIVKDVVDMQVGKEMQKSVSDWLEALAQHCDVVLPTRTWAWGDPWKTICRLSAFRNSIVHAGGDIDRQLVDRLSKIGESAIYSERIGDRLKVREDDIRHSVSKYLEASSLLYLGFCRKQASASGRMESEAQAYLQISNIQWDLISREKYSLAAIIGSCRSLLSDGEDYRPIDLATWTCAAFLGQSSMPPDIESVPWRKDVQSVLHRTAILGTKEDLLALVKDVVDKNGIPRMAIVLLPEFSLVRKILADELESLLVE
ncbi:hypothetical protein [Nocardia sp. NPDC059195]|uniref:hypothetical protein n=1 Tax=Nocardia sp. NPDC059195 TaxID=3346765 RepID=UPI0036A746C5